MDKDFEQIIEELKKAITGGTGDRRNLERKAKELSINKEYHKGLEKFAREKKIRQIIKKTWYNRRKSRRFTGSNKRQP